MKTIFGAPVADAALAITGITLDAVAVALLLAFSACTPAQLATARVNAIGACQVDGTVVPIADAAVALAGGPGAVVAGIDAGVVHPAVVGACAALNGVPVVVPAVPKAGS